uniref:Uncharacterized protein n=1 Tax=Octopus bimaculoides TaxID=37653 RepID=A0A0L8HIA5_OCTBM
MKLVHHISSIYKLYIDFFNDIILSVVYVDRWIILPQHQGNIIQQTEVLMKSIVNSKTNTSLKVYVSLSHAHTYKHSHAYTVIGLVAIML